MQDGLYKAWRVVTMDPYRPEIFEAGILVQNDRIVALDRYSALRGAEQEFELGRVTLCPGLINAHSHLGMSHLQGRIPRGLGFRAWADQVFSLRDKSLTLEALAQAVQTMRTCQTALVADTIGGHASQIQEILTSKGLAGFFFHELSGRRKDDPGQRILSNKSSLAIHALYSTDSGYAQQIKAWCRSWDRPFSLHLAEVPGENELFTSGQGDFADFLRSQKILPKTFVVPGVSVVSFAHSLGLLDQKTLAVHCVQLSEADVEIVAESGAGICLCPRSNSWIGVGQPLAEAMFTAGIPLCLGTDSLASNKDLDLWAELKALRRLLPLSLTLGDLLVLLTINPARILGLEKDWGMLKVGRQACWTVVPQEYSDMLL